jgi:hypothetical protein
MKKWSIIGTIIVILVVWIRWFLEIDHVKDSQLDEEILTSIIQEEIIEEEVIEPEDLTWEISEEVIQEEVEELEEINEEDIIFPDNYPIYWVIEADYWDETPEDGNDPDLQETEKILMQALSEFEQEENNSDL